VPVDRLDELPEADKATKATKRELDMAEQLIGSLTSDFDPERYRDEYRERVLDLIERKAEGEEIAVSAPPAEEAKPVPDLMAALEASINAAKGEEEDGKGARKPARKRAPAKASSNGSGGKKKPGASRKAKARPSKSTSSKASSSKK
jgi:DNA end-binding protein Ku